MRTSAKFVLCLAFLVGCNGSENLDGHCTDSLSTFQQLVGGWKTQHSVSSTSGHNITLKKDTDGNLVIAVYDSSNSQYCIQFSGDGDAALDMLMRHYHPPMTE